MIMKGNTYIALDLKTSGLDCYEDEITAIRAIKFHSISHQELFSCRIIRPGHPDENNSFNGYDLKDLTLLYPDAYAKFLKFIEKSFLLSHYTYADKLFFENACFKYKLPMFDNPWIDTNEIVMAQKRINADKIIEVAKALDIHKSLKKDIFYRAQITKDIFIRSIN